MNKCFNKILKSLSTEVASENFLGHAVRLSSFENFTGSPRLIGNWKRPWGTRIGNSRLKGEPC
ncbi:MAG: hypothetical protein A3A51_03490 [Candidatus Levybacteria bacterium RIFCSPLOWO2_01_FULL_39_10]|nr:MAG: hypothetical protein A3A51_03490 [Candidatus Levybacteria bacterium RIFCSPLOWO2_01_FULL_39_10]